jgi:hypothetical protein
MLFLLGVGMAVLGVALCLLGEIKLPGSRVLKPFYAQICGVILLCYFPLVFLLYKFLGEMDAVWRLAANWFLAVLCVGSVLVIILRTTAPVKPVGRGAAPLRKNGKPSTEEPSVSVEELNPDYSTRKEKSPFDFS